MSRPVSALADIPLTASLRTEASIEAVEARPDLPRRSRPVVGTVLVMRWTGSDVVVTYAETADHGLHMAMFAARMQPDG